MKKKQSTSTRRASPRAKPSAGRERSHVIEPMGDRARLIAKIRKQLELARKEDVSAIKRQMKGIVRDLRGAHFDLPPVIDPELVSSMLFSAGLCVGPTPKFGQDCRPRAMRIFADDFSRALERVLERVETMPQAEGLLADVQAYLAGAGR